mmetsp:Transcript_13883/g.30834  ORF Transcript_13883/g.30834 Transcript_13883/m.30834 type:complete len:250 (+) Transcript_13883:40-789(+)
MTRRLMLLLLRLLLQQLYRVRRRHDFEFVACIVGNFGTTSSTVCYSSSSTTTTNSSSQTVRNARSRQCPFVSPLRILQLGLHGIMIAVAAWDRFRATPILQNSIRLLHLLLLIMLCITTTTSTTTITTTTIIRLPRWQMQLNNLSGSLGGSGRSGGGSSPVRRGLHNNTNNFGPFRLLLLLLPRQIPEALPFPLPLPPGPVGLLLLAPIDGVAELSVLSACCRAACPLMRSGQVGNAAEGRPAVPIGIH